MIHRGRSSRSKQPSSSADSLSPCIQVSIRAVAGSVAPRSSSSSSSGSTYISAGASEFIQADRAEFLISGRRLPLLLQVKAARRLRERERENLLSRDVTRRTCRDSPRKRASEQLGHVQPGEREPDLNARETDLMRRKRTTLFRVCA